MRRPVPRLMLSLLLRPINRRRRPPRSDGRTRPGNSTNIGQFLVRSPTGLKKETAMTTNQERRSHLPALLFATAALAIGASPARAQWEFPWIGMGGFNYVPSPGEYLNQRSLINAQNA